jgi:PAS domain S-box-containing protein
VKPQRTPQILLPLAAFVAVVGLVATFWTYRVLETAAEDKDAARFASLLESRSEVIEDRLHAYESVLHSASGFIGSNPEVPFADWQDYVTHLPLEKMAPGLLGIGTITPVSAADRPAFTAAQEAATGGLFRYRTVDDVPAPEESYIIHRIEPYARNQSALGLDIASETNRRVAFETARDTGQIQVTGIITLVQDEQKTPGFLLILPLYEPDRPLDSVENRRQHFIGAVYAPMIGKDVLSLPSSDSLEIDMVVYDETVDESHLIFASGNPEDVHSATRTRIIEYPYAGRTWLVQAWPNDLFIPSADVMLHRGFLGSGFVLSLLLTLMLLQAHRNQAKVARLAEEMTAKATESEHINDLFVEHAPAAIAFFDNDLHFVSASQQWMKQFELEEDIIGRHHYEVFPEVGAKTEWVAVHQRSLAGSHESGGPDYLLRPDGTEMYLRWEVHPWTRADESIGGILVFSQDVTSAEINRLELIRAQKELEIAEERLRQATRAGQIGIWDWHIDSSKLVWNDEMFELFGCQRSEGLWTAEDFREAVHPEDRDRVMKAVQSTVDQDQEFQLEYRTCRPDHPTVLALGRLQRDDEGQPERMIGVCVDISAQAAIRRELTQAAEQHAIARRKAEQMATARDRFLANMSHEIRTPLGGMIGMTELLSETPLDATQQDYVRTISECGQALLSLINDILDLSKILAGKITFSHEPFDPADLIHRVLRVLDPQLANAPFDIERVIKIPPSLKVIGDDTRIQQVLLNLVGNATKFTEKGSIRIELEATEHETGEMKLTYRVVDTGVGMDDEELERVMEPFVQADPSTTRKYGGTGLGLSISQSLVEAMGGRLTIKSEKGRGTSATMTLILPPARHEAPPDDPPSKAADASAARRYFQRALIVEDNPVNQRLARLQLAEFVESVDLADNGLEGVNKIRSQAYDLVLMDCQMPVMDGFEATRRIREFECSEGRTPCTILALTANVFESDREASLNAGMDGFLAKPLKKKVLRDALIEFSKHHPELKDPKGELNEPESGV